MSDGWIDDNFPFEIAYTAQKLGMRAEIVDDRVSVFLKSASLLSKYWRYQWESNTLTAGMLHSLRIFFFLLFFLILLYRFITIISMWSCIAWLSIIRLKDAPEKQYKTAMYIDRTIVRPSKQNPTCYNQNSMLPEKKGRCMMEFQTKMMLVIFELGVKDFMSRVILDVKPCYKLLSSNSAIKFSKKREPWKQVCQPLEFVPMATLPTWEAGDGEFEFSPFHGGLGVETCNFRRRFQLSRLARDKAKVWKWVGS